MQSINTSRWCLESLAPFATLVAVGKVVHFWFHRPQLVAVDIKLHSTVESYEEFGIQSHHAVSTPFLVMWFFSLGINGLTRELRCKDSPLVQYIQYYIGTWLIRWETLCRISISLWCIFKGWVLQCSDRSSARISFWGITFNLTSQFSFSQHVRGWFHTVENFTEDSKKSRG